MGLSDFLLSLGASLLASLIAIVVVFGFERFKIPDLQISVSPKVALNPWDRKHLHVLVRNQPLGWLWRCFLVREPAFMCRALVTFMDEENKPLFEGRAMNGRWAHTPEPVDIVGVGQTRRNPYRARPFIDIPPDWHEPLDIVARGPRDTTCLGWSNDVIEREPDERDFMLGPGTYHVLLSVRTGQTFKHHVVRLVNSEDSDGFRLEELPNQPKLGELPLPGPEAWGPTEPRF